MTNETIKSAGLFISSWLAVALPPPLTGNLLRSPTGPRTWRWKVFYIGSMPTLGLLCARSLAPAPANWNASQAGSVDSSTVSILGVRTVQPMPVCRHSASLIAADRRRRCRLWADSRCLTCLRQQPNRTTRKIECQRRQQWCCWYPSFCCQASPRPLTSMVRVYLILSMFSFDVVIVSHSFHCYIWLRDQVTTHQRVDLKTNWPCSRVAILWDSFFLVRSLMSNASLWHGEYDTIRYDRRV